MLEGWILDEINQKANNMVNASYNFYQFMVNEAKATGVTVLEKMPEREYGLERGK